MKIFNNIIDNMLGNTISDLYGSEEKPNKSAIGIGIFFSVVFAILLLIFVFFNNTENGMKIYLGYFIFTSFSLSFFAFSSYFFQKKGNKNKFKILKKSSFII